jgi:hypothetical protein
MTTQEEANIISESKLFTWIASHIEVLTSSLNILMLDPHRLTPEYRAKLIMYLSILDKYRFLPEDKMKEELKQ